MKLDLNKPHIKGIIAISVIGIAFIFFILGCAFTTNSFATIARNIQIENLEIDLNETQLVDSIMPYMEEYKKELEEEAWGQQDTSD